MYIEVTERLRTNLNYFLFFLFCFGDLPPPPPETKKMSVYSRHEYCSLLESTYSGSYAKEKGAIFFLIFLQN